MRRRIVITGGPASGKTESWQRLKQDVRFSEFVFLEELARRLLRQEPAFRRDQAGFHKELYYRQVAREDRIASQRFITDRGTIDAFAFHPATMAAVKTSLEREYRRYDRVIQLGSTAALGEEFYEQDDIRRESIEEALTIEEALRYVWSGHPEFYFIGAYRDFESKYQALVNLIA